jgi:hypothetical protein
MILTGKHLHQSRAPVGGRGGELGAARRAPVRVGVMGARERDPGRQPERGSPLLRLFVLALTFLNAIFASALSTSVITTARELVTSSRPH